MVIYVVQLVIVEAGGGNGGCGSTGSNSKVGGSGGHVR